MSIFTKIHHYYKPSKHKWVDLTIGLLVPKGGEVWECSKCSEIEFKNPEMKAEAGKFFTFADKDTLDRYITTKLEQAKLEARKDELETTGIDILIAHTVGEQHKVRDERLAQLNKKGNE